MTGVVFGRWSLAVILTIELITGFATRADAGVVLRPVKLARGRTITRAVDRPPIASWVEGDPIDVPHWARWLHPDLSPEEALEASIKEIEAQAVGGTESVAIRNPRRRPSLYAAPSGLAPNERIPHEWYAALDARREMLQEIAGSVGRIEVYDLERSLDRRFIGQAVGTAFVVAPSILMTNAHVAKAFIGKNGKFLTNYETSRPASVWVNFGATLGESIASGHRFKVTDAIWVSSDPEVDRDIALLRFEDPRSQGPPPLKLCNDAPQESLLARKAVVFGYPIGDPTYFAVPAVKRMAPGKLAGVSSADGRARSILYHDASTTNGNSGSPVVDLETGLVYGVHFSGQTQQNGSEPAWDVLSITSVRTALGLAEPAPIITAAEESPHETPRPSFVVDDSGSPGPELSKLDTGVNMEAVARSARSVGWLREKSDVESRAGGTVFMVAPGMIVAPAFLVERARSYEVTFDRTFDAIGETYYAVQPIEASGGLVLLRIDAQAETLPAPIETAPENAHYAGASILVVSHPVADARTPTAVFLAVFPGAQGVKRASPGKLMSEATDPEILHDASTAAGSAGGPILDAATGKVIGIHTGSTLDGPNQGIPISAIDSLSALDGDHAG